MATQRPVGTRSTSTKAPVRATGKTPARDNTPRHDLGADTTIWHTRGLQTNSRIRAPLVQRTPQRQLPPSPVPRLILWAVLIGVALVCFHAVKQMLR